MWHSKLKTWPTTLNPASSQNCSSRDVVLPNGGETEIPFAGVTMRPARPVVLPRENGILVSAAEYARRVTWCGA